MNSNPDLPASAPSPVPAKPDQPVSALTAAATQPPGMISVMHPEGFTPYAVEGVTLDQPLFARVTYWPS